MAPNRPPKTGYERLAQADQLSDDDDGDNDFLVQSTASLQPASAPIFAPITQPRPHSGMTSPEQRRYQRRGTSNSLPYDNSGHYSKGYNGNGAEYGGPGSRPGRHRRAHSNSGVDLKAINARLERWADEVATKFKRIGRTRRRGTGLEDDEDDEKPLEIHHSVFQPAVDASIPPVTKEMLAAAKLSNYGQAMTRTEFETIVDSVRVAIEQGVQPRMIAQGSSGSYFARNTEGKVVGVFKPKDEEPYAAGNPKWNKWIHRNLFPCCFGRACLIPNLSYVSEAAAYTLDTQLQTHMVPYTDIVWLASRSFHYPFWDRYNYSRNRKQLPAKPGSFQVFLKGFKDANIFLREHPWPDQYLSGYRTGDTHRNRRKKRWAEDCRPSSSAEQGADSDNDDDSAQEPVLPGPNNFVWTDSLKQKFREELEKLVILDYIMRNTDRGLDNWMIKVDWETQEVSIASEPLHMDLASNTRRDENGETVEGPRPADMARIQSQESTKSAYAPQRPMEAAAKKSRRPRDPLMSVGAIDNSLSWPWKHPDAWRSFPFGWLFLPVDLIGRPFSQRTRDHFLPLLTSTAWWSQTQLALRKVFQIDPDFQEKMFSRQIAVMKGQAWNVVETLKQADHGPLELTRRSKVCVWDDLVDVPIAVPLRMTSSTELQRRRATENAPRRPDDIEEEMDIGATGAAVAADSTAAAAAVATGRTPADQGNQPDLLDMPSPPADLPHPGRFELTSVMGGDDEMNTAAFGAEPTSPTQQQITGKSNRPQSNARAIYSGQPETTNHTVITSHSQSQSQSQNPQQQQRERRYSFASPNGGAGGGSLSRLRRVSSGAGGTFGSGGGSGRGGGDNDEDGDFVDEGDLGYAAAAGMEGNRRKVIVERLEPVKARNPVFTWC